MAESVKRVMVAADAERPEMRSAAEEFAASLEGKADTTIVDTHDGKALSEADADVLVVFGGDGSMLAVARGLEGNPVPVVGVNLGRFGFLTHFSAATIERDFASVLAGDMDIRRWMMLKCSVTGTSGESFTGTALNDVVIGTGPVSRMVSVELHVNGEHAATYRGDGVIVASPAGSTAHSLSAGGPIVSPAMEAFVLTPVCPHTLTDRPLVVPSGAKVMLRPGGDTSLALDGQVTCGISEGDEVTVERAPSTFNVVANARRTYYSLLKDKLNWGRPPAYGQD